MLIRHASPKRNFFPIIEDGLLCAKAQGKRKVVWLHTSARTSWAMIHTVRRHGGRIQDVVVFEVDVPRSWLRKSGRGLWYCVKDIPPARIVGVVDFQDLSQSPVEEPA